MVSIIQTNNINPASILSLQTRQHKETNREPLCGGCKALCGYVGMRALTEVVAFYTLWCCKVRICTVVQQASHHLKVAFETS